MKFNYDSVDWTFLSGILEENNRRLSRTHRGISDTSSSAQKLPLLLTGDALKERAQSNERAVHRYIFENRRAEVLRGC